MTAAQNHGFLFEKQIKDILLIKDSISYTNKWDIPKVHTIGTPFENYNISIKAVKENGAINMADALRIWSLEEDFYLFLIYYKQINDIKTPISVDTILITKTHLEKLKGDLTYQDIQQFSNGLKNFKKNQHKEARQYAKNEKRRLKSKMGSIILNPKIDSKTQRRLQCSIPNKNIKDLFMSFNSEFFNDEITSIKSPPRNFKG